LNSSSNPTPNHQQIDSDTRENQQTEKPRSPKLKALLTFEFLALSLEDRKPLVAEGPNFVKRKFWRSRRWDFCCWWIEMEGK